MESKIQELKDLKKIRAQLRSKGKKIVFTNGCFDLIHNGHVHLLKKAKRHGDILVVGINADESVTRLKGPHRPVFALKERLEILEALEAVDYLISFSEDTPQKLISVLLPDVLVKGGDWKPEEIVGKEEVESAGGKVVVIPYLESYSTSEIISRICKTGEN
jgi:D-beta-D-heptose 7-phosphate kinase/D-beta-D-heptose 1-phosphate adenosyltransferase